MTLQGADNIHEYPVAASGNDVAAPAANTAAVVTYSAGATGVQHVISGIAWSYSGGTPTGGNLLIQDGGTTVFNMDITAQGAGIITFAPAKKGTAANSLTITLAAGGGGVSGKVSVLAHWTEGPGP